MPKTGNKNNSNNVVPTLDEYIAMQIGAKRASALDKSRTRTLPSYPLKGEIMTEQEWRNNLNRRRQVVANSKMPVGIKALQMRGIEQEANAGYYNYVGSNCIGPTCAITASDNYGMNFIGSEQFRQNHEDYGFKRIDNSNVSPSDIVIDVENGIGSHTMILNSGNVLDNNLRFNHSNGGFGQENIRKNAKYPFRGVMESYTYTGTPADSTQWTNEYKQLYGNQMKCGGRRKAQLGLDIREGGIAIPIAPNMYYMNGRSHNEGGIGIGPNNKNGLEVEGGEVVKVGDKDIKVFSSVPLLRGVSPAQLVMGGANPTKVFKAQEEFKDRNRINDDGTRYQTGGQKIYTASRWKKELGGTSNYYSIMEKVAKDNYKRWGFNNEDEALMHVLNDNTYDYRGYYNKYPNSLANADTHWTDEFKTVYHPTFSIESKYSGNKSIYNPLGLEGGYWDEDNFVPAKWQKNKKEYGGDGNVLPEVVVTGKKPKTFFERVDDYADVAEKALAVPNMALSGYSLIAPNPYTAAGAYLTGLAGGGIDIYQGIRSAIKGDWFNAGKNAIDLGMSLVGLRALRNANKLNSLDKSLDASGVPREYITKMVGRGRGRHKATFTKEKNEALIQEGIGYGMIPGSAAMSLMDTNKSRKKKEYGGNMIYTVNGNVKNGLMSARPKAQYGKTVKINRDSYETVEETVERYKQLYRIRYGKEPSKSDIDRVAWTKSLENAVNGDPNLITGYGPNVGVRGPNVTKIVSGANRGKQIARTQTTVRNKNVKSATPQRQAVNTKVSEAARAERQSQFDAWQQGEAFNASTMPTDAVAVNRPTIGTGVRSGRKGRVDDVVAIERSQRNNGVDPLASRKPYNLYNSLYAERFASTGRNLAGAIVGTTPITVGGAAYLLDYDDENVKDSANTNDTIPANKAVKNTKSNKVSNTSQPSYTINGTFDNARPQFYAEKRLPIAGSQSIGEKAGLARSGWSYADNEPISLNYMPNINLTIPTNYGKDSTPRRGETKARSSKAVTKPQPTLQGTVNQITRDAIYKSNTPKIDLSKAKMPTYDVSQLGNKESKTYKANTPKSGRWVGQYKSTNVGDWIGLGSNLAGTVASYFMTKNAINKMPDPIKPVIAQAAKLKTRYNVEPQLTNIREAEQTNRAAVRRNTQSSSVSLAREQRIMNETRNARNQLYGQKENIETQLINQDRLNRQSVMMDNVRAYNEYLNKLTATRQGQNQLRISNINNLLSGLTGSVNNIPGTIESRRATNNTFRAIAAANPNVDARLIGGFDYYIDPITKRKYNKNQQYIGTING